MTITDAVVEAGADSEVVRPRVFASAVAENILRLRIAADASGAEPSELVLPEHSAANLTEVVVGATGRLGGFEVRRGEVFLEILDAAGTSLLRISSASLSPVDLVRYDTGDEAPQVVAVRTVDGERTTIANLVTRPDGQAFAAEIGLLPKPGEGFYGLGQEEDGGYQRRGAKVHLYQHNMRIPMPCLVSDAGYGLLFDCGSLLTWDGRAEEQVLSMNAVSAIDFYLIAGGADEVVRGFRRLTGAAPMLPKWAFGYIQSKERYTDADELVGVAERYRELGVPLDAVVQDWKTWSGDQWGQKTVDPVRFPDLPAMRARLEALDVHSMVSVWPNMALECPDHAEFAAAGLLLCDHSTYDALSPEGRDLYWKQLRQLYLGFDSWWCDSSEPFSAPDWQGSVLLSEDQRFDLVGREHERCLGARQANLYALEHARGIYEHELAEQRAGTGPVRRVLNLTRSGYPGTQRYGAVLWSGDVSATWSTLRGEVAKAISMGLCGVPWWTTDAGAFFVGGTECWRRWCGDPDAAPVWFWNGDYDDGVADPRYRELYVRWLQFACFLPMFRSHGTDTPREIWNFGKPGDECYEAIAATIRLRYRLLPYIYTLAAEASRDGGVMVRALLFDFVDDPRAREISDQFLLGDAFLVCPVLAASVAVDVSTTRECYLPAGTDWHDFWTGERFAGGQTIEVTAPLGQVPLFVRAGAVIPLQAPVNHSLANHDEFDIVIYPGANGAGHLYDDDGLSHDYASGGYTLVSFDWLDQDRTLTVRADAWARTVPLTLRLHHAGQSRETSFDGTATTITFEERS